MDFKITMIGPTGVGKSCLQVMYITGNFVEEYEPTIEERYRPCKTVDDESAIIEIIDPSGQEELVALQTQSVRFEETHLPPESFLTRPTFLCKKQMMHCDGFMLCFALNQRQTFLELGGWLERIRNVKGPESTPCIVLVGTKCDLEEERDVSRLEEEEWAKNHRLPVIECSAKTSFNVAEAFAVLIRLIRQQREPKRREKQQHTKQCVLQ